MFYAASRARRGPGRRAGDHRPATSRPKPARWRRADGLPRVSRVLVATHDGSFHADEVFAIAALGLLGEPVEVIRTRDRDALAKADLRIDVGFRDDARTGDFDHHQRDFDAARDNGVRYASFGLVWRAFGDAGLRRRPGRRRRGRRDARAVSGCQRHRSAADPLAARGRAADHARRAHRRLQRALGRDPHARDRNVSASMRPSSSRATSSPAKSPPPPPAGARNGSCARRSPPRRTRALVELPVNAPWKQVLVPEAADALFVIYPKRQGFGLEAVPRELGSFDNRRDLPAAWGGLEGAELVAVDRRRGRAVLPRQALPRRRPVTRRHRAARRARARARRRLSPTPARVPGVAGEEAPAASPTQSATPSPQPPSMMISWPVTYAEPGDARNRASGLMSSG